MHRRAGVIAAALIAAVGFAPTASAGGRSVATPEPVVLIPGWHGKGGGFTEVISALESAGFTVLDFDPATPGTQALNYGPNGDGQHISYLAGHVVEEQILAALSSAGYDADTQRVDIVAHSMGGLVARFLIEQPGADVDRWSSEDGWHGDGEPDVADTWADRVDDLVLLGTPNHGTWEAWVPATLGGFGDWNASGGDMRPGSRFLRRMGTDEPSGEDYYAIGGDPWYLRWLRDDTDGDGIAHGFDGVVPAESPYLTGAVFDIVGVNHGALLTGDMPLDLVVARLGHTGPPPPSDDDEPLTGDAVVRLEYAEIVADHDFGTKDDNVFDVYVDPDGGNDSYQHAGRIKYRRDAPFVKDWGDDGPVVDAVALPGTSPRMDVRMVVWEKDLWGSEPISIVTFADVTQSEDRDGLAYYEAVAPDDEGGLNTFRISVLGVTSQPGN